MVAFINKYKCWIYFAFFIFVFIIMFFPYKINYDAMSTRGIASSFDTSASMSKMMSQSDYPYDFLSPNQIQLNKSIFIMSIFADIFIILGLLSCIVAFVFINKKYSSYSLGFIFLSVACVLKIFFQAYYRNTNQEYTIIKYGDAWSDYVIISIALLMLIVDFLRLSLYIRNHREQIAAKLSALKPPPRERKPSKDERIAELEERVRQLEDSKKDG